MWVQIVYIIDYKNIKSYFHVQYWYDENYPCQFQQAANNSSGIADNHKGVSNRSGMEDRSQINSQETSSTPMITHPGTCNNV